MWAPGPCGYPRSPPALPFSDFLLSPLSPNSRSKHFGQAKSDSIPFKPFSLTRKTTSHQSRDFGMRAGLVNPSKLRLYHHTVESPQRLLHPLSSDCIINLLNRADYVDLIISFSPAPLSLLSSQGLLVGAGTPLKSRDTGQ